MKKAEIIYGPLELPSGTQIKFREAKGIDRANVLQMQKPAKKKSREKMKKYKQRKRIKQIDHRKTRWPGIKG